MLKDIRYFDTVALRRAWQNIERKNSDVDARRIFYGGVLDKIQEFAVETEKMIRKSYETKIQELTTFGDTPPQGFNDTGAFFRDADIDLGYEQGYLILNESDLEGKESMSVQLITNGVTFERVEEGEAAKVYTVTGSRTTAFFDAFRGAVGFSNQWLDDQLFYKFNNLTGSLIGKALRLRSQTFYDVITTAAETPTDIAWGGAAGQSNAARDAETINDGIQSLIVSVEDQGYEVTAASPFILYTPIQLFSRALTAVAIQLSSAASDIPVTVPYNVQVVPTNRLTRPNGTAMTDHFVLVLPGRELQLGYRQNLIIMQQADILRYSTTVAGQMRYAGVAGNTNQMRFLDTA